MMDRDHLKDLGLDGRGMLKCKQMCVAVKRVQQAKNRVQ